ncbi:MAG: AAA family ATPase [Allobaculum sp.]|nr:AAA family ATPase [Allobaculum sp.]
MDVISFEDVYQNLPPFAPELVEGIVRRGHKMLVSGSSKAGKSFALIELAIAVAEGREWMGHQCSQGKVLYLNFEIDGNSFLNRIAQVYEALGWPIKNSRNLQFMNLRGHAEPLNELTPRLEAWLKKHPVDLVIIDPIYKIITGDENNASDMGKFCNLFDRIAEGGGCTVAYCHHHSKGSQAHKQVIDRASGSGVFARDPDAIIDMTEIGFSEEERIELKAQLSEMIDDAYLKTSRQWDNLALTHPEDLTNRLAKQLLVQEHLNLNPENREIYQNNIEKAEILGSCPAFRVSFVLREFKSPEDCNIFFQHPIHIPDTTNFLSELYLVGDNSLNKLSKRKERADKKRSDEKRDWYEEQRSDGEMVSISDMVEEFGCVPKTIHKWVDNQEDLKRENGWILRKDEIAPPKKPRGKGK